MKKLVKISLISIGVIVLTITGLVFYVKLALPNVGEAEDIKVEITPQRVERGKYLANHVAVCMDCHSTRDWSQFSGPIKDGTLGMGGEVFDKKLGFPGNFYAKNITPHHLSDWSDGELLRGITSGVNKKGEALFPVMPHPNYGKMDKEDIYAIIAYIRTLSPVASNVPESKATFPMSIFLNLIPKKATYNAIPNINDTINYGEYIFNTASCTDCHTQRIKGKPLEGMHLAGGFEFPLINGGIVRSSNITPDKETGIGNWSEELFVRRFKVFSDSSYQSAEIKKGEFNTVMPWVMYSSMTETDLKAIYKYLQTIKPVNNEVVKFTPQN